MKPKHYLLASSLCCMLPTIAHGVDIVDKDPVPGPRSPARSILKPPVTIEIELGLLTLYFTSDLGEVYVLIEQVTGEMAYSQSVDTAMQDQASFMIPAGTYMLTITDTTGNMIKQESIVIP